MSALKHMQPYTITCWGDLRSHAVGIRAALAHRLQGQGKGERGHAGWHSSGEHLCWSWVASTQGVREGDAGTLPLCVERGRAQSQEITAVC